MRQNFSFKRRAVKTQRLFLKRRRRSSPAPLGGRRERRGGGVGVASRLVCLLSGGKGCCRHSHTRREGEEGGSRVEAKAADRAGVIPEIPSFSLSPSPLFSLSPSSPWTRFLTCFALCSAPVPSLPAARQGLPDHFEIYPPTPHLSFHTTPTQQPCPHPPPRSPSRTPAR